MAITYACGHVVTVSRHDQVHNLYPARCPVCGAPMFPDVELPETEGTEKFEGAEETKAGEVSGSFKAEVDTVSRAWRKRRGRQ